MFNLISKHLDCIGILFAGLMSSVLVYLILTMPVQTSAGVPHSSLPGEQEDCPIYNVCRIRVPRA